MAIVCDVSGTIFFCVGSSGVTNVVVVVVTENMMVVMLLEKKPNKKKIKIIPCAKIDTKLDITHWFSQWEFNIVIQYCNTIYFIPMRNVSCLIKKKENFPMIFVGLVFE